MTAENRVGLATTGDSHIRPPDPYAADAHAIALDREQDPGMGPGVEQRARPACSASPGQDDSLGNGNVLPAAQIKLDVVVDPDRGTRRRQAVKERRHLVVGGDRDIGPRGRGPPVLRQQLRRVPLPLRAAHQRYARSFGPIPWNSRPLALRWW